MSLGSTCRACDLEFSSRGMAGFFAQPTTLGRPTHLRMFGDILRFYRDARTILDAPEPTAATLGEYLADRGFGAGFRRALPGPDHVGGLVDGAGPHPRVPVDYLLRFLDHHGLIGYRRSLEWRVIRGGSRIYVDRIVGACRPGPSGPGRQWSGWSRRRRGHGRDRRRGARAVRRRRLATHADDALRLLGDADERERSVLGAFEYSTNQVVLHTDERVMPTRRRAWASWNVTPPTIGPGDRLTMTYHMNRLQSLAGARRVLRLGQPRGPESARSACSSSDR